jgi:hypothetical protein
LYPFAQNGRRVAQFSNGEEFNVFELCLLDAPDEVFLKGLSRDELAKVAADIGTRRRPTAPPERFTTRLQSIWGSSGIRNKF